MKYQCPFCHEYNIEEKDNKYICKNCSKEITEENIIRIVKINKDASNGQYKCPKCGASQIIFNEKKKALECNFCGCLFNDKPEDDNKIKSLKGVVKGKGSIDIDKDFKNLVVVKCNGCGSEVVVDINNKTTSRCQWCRSILALNDISESGFSPDKILPFKLTKKEAFEKMQDFTKTNVNYFGNEDYKKDLTIDNIIGVYMPYLVVDVNTHAKLKGVGKHYVDYKKHSRPQDYTVETYNVEREYDIYIDDLPLESNSYNSMSNESRTNNIINAVMPFDTQNAVNFTSNYLIGYNGEKRDLDQKDLESDMNTKVTNISKTLLRADKNFYNGGVQWNDCDVKIIGSKWISFYLPIWLYSFQEKTSNGKLTHYLAVNGRTGATMGSAPISEKKVKDNSTIVTLVMLCIFFPIIVIISFGLFSIFNSILLGSFSFILMQIALIVFVSKVNKKGITKALRNPDAKFDYERITKKSFSIKDKKDIKISTGKEKI